MNNPYQSPAAAVTPDDPMAALQYGGFWRRVGASVIDSILILLVTAPFLYAFYGESFYAEQSLIRGPADFIISYLFPAVASITFWVYKSATPGKMVFGLKIVDAETAGPCSTGQLIGRYLGYYPSFLVIGLGFIWIAFDKRKQGWHDKMAGTVVIRN